MEKAEALPHMACTHSYTSTLTYSPGKEKKADTKESSPKLFRVKKKKGELLTLKQIRQNINIC